MLQLTGMNILSIYRAVPYDFGTNWLPIISLIFANTCCSVSELSAPGFRVKFAIELLIAGPRTVLYLGPLIIYSDVRIMYNLTYLIISHLHDHWQVLGCQ